jgi:hypothetical protein
MDIGGGASRLVDALLDEGFSAITVLDLSEKALETSKARLGALSAAKAKWGCRRCAPGNRVDYTTCGTTAPHFIFWLIPVTVLPTPNEFCEPCVLVAT